MIKLPSAIQQPNTETHGDAPSDLIQGVLNVWTSQKQEDNPTWNVHLRIFAGDAWLWTGMADPIPILDMLRYVFTTQIARFSTKNILTFKLWHDEKGPSQSG